MRGKEQDPIAYSVFFRFFNEYILLRISGKISDWFLWWQNFHEWYLHFNDIKKGVSLSLNGCTSELNNYFIISDNSKNKKKYTLLNAACS